MIYDIFNIKFKIFHKSYNDKYIIITTKELCYIEFDILRNQKLVCTFADLIHSYIVVGALHLRVAAISIVAIARDIKKNINQILMLPAFSLCLSLRYNTTHSIAHAA
jgi:alanine dehydrogenase